MHVAELAGEAGADVLGDREQIGRGGGRLSDGFEDGREVADRDALAQEVLQDALDAGDGDLSRARYRQTRAACGLGRSSMSWRHAAEGEQFGHVLFDQLGEVRGEDGGGVDDGVALDGRGVPSCVSSIQTAGRPKTGSLTRSPGQAAGSAAGVHGEMELRAQLAAAGDHFLDEDAVVFRAELEVVDDADLRNDEAELRGDLAADGLDLIGELAARGFVDEAKEAEAEFDLDVVDRQRVLDRRLGDRLGALGLATSSA